MQVSYPDTTVYGCGGGAAAASLQKCVCVCVCVSVCVCVLYHKLLVCVAAFVVPAAVLVQILTQKTLL